MNSAPQPDVRLDLVQEVIARGEEVPLKAHGLSMGHTVRDGEWILVQRVAPEQIRVGEIVLYRIPTTFVAHRVIRRWRDHGDLFFQTKGDGHLSCDPPLRGTDVVARVVGVRRGNGVRQRDQREGLALSKLLLWHSLALWYLYRLFRPLMRLTPAGRGGPANAGSRWARRLLLMPQALLVRLWNRTTQHAPD